MRASRRLNEPTKRADSIASSRPRSSNEPFSIRPVPTRWPVEPNTRATPFANLSWIFPMSARATVPLISSSGSSGVSATSMPVSSPSADSSLNSSRGIATRQPLFARVTKTRDTSVSASSGFSGSAASCRCAACASTSSASSFSVARSRTGSDLIVNPRVTEVAVASSTCALAARRKPSGRASFQSTSIASIVPSSEIPAGASSGAIQRASVVTGPSDALCSFARRWPGLISIVNCGRGESFCSRPRTSCSICSCEASPRRRNRQLPVT